MWQRVPDLLDVGRLLLHVGQLSLHVSHLLHLERENRRFIGINVIILAILTKTAAINADKNVHYIGFCNRRYISEKGEIAEYGDHDIWSSRS
jgi:hypothetical protein